MKPKTQKPRASRSRARSYQEIGEYWDAHDIPSSTMRDRAPKFSVDIQRRRFLVAIEPALFAKVRRRAAKKGLSAESLLNLWVQEKCAKSR